MQLILASRSPRRVELLAQLGYPFTAEPSLFEEQARGLSPRETALTFARGKAEEVFSRFRGSLVLGADTVVALHGEIFGKPKDAADAARMLRALSGKTHTVLTGVCLLGEGIRRYHVSETAVTFHNLSKELIADYVASGLPADKAGAYGIQDGYPLVRSYEGSYTNVVGLPVEAVRAMLESALGGSKC